MQRKLLISLFIFICSFLVIACSADKGKTDNKSNEQENSTQQTDDTNTLPEETDDVSEEPDEKDDEDQTDDSEKPAEQTKTTIQLLEADENLEYGIPVTKEIEASTEEEQIKETVTLALESFAVKIDQVIIADQVATINFNKESLTSIVSSAQYGLFMDYVSYAMAENFPQIKGYYFQADNEPTSIGESAVYDEMIENTLREHMYLKMKDD